MKKKILSLILLSALSISCLYGCSSGVEKPNSSTSKVEENKVENVQEEINIEPVIERYKLGDVVRISTEDGDYEICFTSITEIDERNQFAENNPPKVVLISYKYANIDYSKKLYDGSISNEISINSWDLKVYDADGNLLNTYPATMNFGSGVTPGHKGTGEIAYGLDNDSNYLEIEYSANLFDSYTCVFDLEW